MYFLHSAMQPPTNCCSLALSRYIFTLKNHMKVMDAFERDEEDSTYESTIASNDSSVSYVDSVDEDYEFHIATWLQK